MTNYFTIYFEVPQISSESYFVLTHSSQRTSVSHILAASFMNQPSENQNYLEKNSIVKNMYRL